VPYVDPMSTTLSAINDIQANFAALAAGPASAGFAGVLEQISSVGGNGPSTYGWPMEEGQALPGAVSAAQSTAPVASTLLSPGTGQASAAAATAGPATATLSGPATVFSERQPASSPVPSSGVGSTSFGLGSSYLQYQQDSSSGALGAGLELASSAGTPSATGPGGALGGLSSTPGAEGSAASGSIGQQAVAVAQKFLGVPYLWGGTNPAQGVDCSGLVQDVYGELGIDLPRTSEEQALAGVAVPSLADAQPGDLVFFPGSDGTAASPGHVGIYIGNDEMIDAPYTGSVVRVDQVGEPTEIRRVTGLASVAAGTGTTGTGTTGTVGASPYDAQFAASGAAYGVPAQLLSAVAETESNYQPTAVSGAGAEGLMQLMPSTAASLGVNPFDPDQAVNGAARLLSQFYGTYGSWSLALAAYNAGPTAVNQYGGIPPYPQTQGYVNKVLALAGMEDQ